MFKDTEKSEKWHDRGLFGWVKSHTAKSFLLGVVTVLWLVCLFNG